MDNLSSRSGALRFAGDVHISRAQNLFGCVICLNEKRKIGRVSGPGGCDRYSRFIAVTQSVYDAAPRLFLFGQWRERRALDDYRGAMSD
jgi:hypothetical protein